ALEPLATARFNELCAHGQVPTFTANAQGLPQLSNWTTPAYFGVVYRDLLADLPMYGLRIQTFAANKAQAMAQSMRAKKEVVAAADVEMADAREGVAGPGPSTIQSMVDKAVAARMKKLEKPDGKGKSKGKGKDNGKKKTSSSSNDARRPPEVKHPQSRKKNSKSGRKGKATGSKNAKGKGKGKRGGKK
ncbi:predicted protein, partial [Postia placenta Mad-698-R]